jgi:hypothetical protein
VSDRSGLPPAAGADLTDLGIVIATTGILFAARAVLEQTWLSFHRGTAGEYGSALGLSSLVVLAVGMLWVTVLVLATMLRKRRASLLDKCLVAVLIAGAVLLTVPGEEWRLLTAQVGGARRAPKEWVIGSASRGEMRLLRYLLSHGADPNTRISNGQTALGAAAAAGQIAASEFLIASGALIDQRSGSTGQTALIEAAQERRAEVVRLLLAGGANPAARDAAGLTAEDWARRNDDPGIIALLSGPSSFR